MGVLDTINAVSEKVEEALEGSPILPKLMNDPVFVRQIEDLVDKYSRLPFSVTPHFEGSTGEFLHFILRIFPKTDPDLKLAEIALKNAVEYFFRRNMGQLVSAVVISDPVSNSGYDIHVYFGHTRCQSKKLGNWFSSLSQDEYDRAIRDFRGLKDPALQKELNQL